MAASLICLMHITERTFTKHDHDEVITEQERFLPHITSSLEYCRTYFPEKKIFKLSHEVKLRFCFKRDSQPKLTNENIVVITSFYDYEVL